MSYFTPWSNFWRTNSLISFPDFCQSHAAGVHADPNDCFGYIMCDMAGNTHEMSCPAGLKFNPAILGCDWPNNVECEDTGSEEPAGQRNRVGFGPPTPGQ